MKYVRLNQGQPEVVTHSELKAENPNTSFPKELGDLLLTNWDLYRLIESPRQTYDRLTEKVVLSYAPGTGRDYLQVWTVEALPAAEAQANQDAELDRIADSVLTDRGALRAFALVMLDEINALRTAASLPTYTAAQLRTAVRNRING